MNFESVEDTSKYKRILIYGNFGVGKTTFAAKAPKVLFLDTEQGTSSLSKLPKELREQIRIKRLKTYEEANEVLTYLARNPTEFETVVVDTLSEFQAKILDQQLKDAAVSGKRSIFIPYQADYGENTQRLRRFIINLLSLPLHVIILAQEEVKQDEESQLVTSPALTPKIKQTVCILMDAIGYLTSEIKKGTYTSKLTLMPSPRLIGKNRLPVPEVIENPDINQLLKAKNED